MAMATQSIRGKELGFKGESGFKEDCVPQHHLEN